MQKDPFLSYDELRQFLSNQFGPLVPQNGGALLRGKRKFSSCDIVAELERETAKLTIKLEPKNGQMSVKCSTACVQEVFSRPGVLLCVWSLDQARGQSFLSVTKEGGIDYHEVLARG